MSTARFLAGAILLLSAAALLADEAMDEFNKLYGDELNRLATKPLPADGVALARRMLDDARKMTDQPALLALVYEKVYELGAKDPSGYAVATAAMDLLAEKAPEKRVDCLQKNLALYQKQYATARAEAKTKAGEKVIDGLSALAEAQTAAEDCEGAAKSLRLAMAVAAAIKSADLKKTLQDHLDDLAPQLKIDKQLAALKAKLDADPKDAASRKEVVRLYLVEMDNPAGAVKFLDENLDAPTRKYLPAAAKPVEKAPESDCLELGEWYRGLVDQATTPASKWTLRRRAQAYYQRFLMLHKASDMARTDATLALKRIEDALANLGPGAEPRSLPPNLTLELGKGVMMKLVLIHPGKFVMGSPESEAHRTRDEGPQHEVTISRPFYMGATEVTQAQYEAIAGTNPCPNRAPSNPVFPVSWNAAADFCSKLSDKARRMVRLPTEAEWEYACRAGTKTRSFFGESQKGHGDYMVLAGYPQPVATKKPNPWGLYDMHGNVWEWCADWYGPYSADAALDPQGPPSGKDRALRGGSLYSEGWVSRSAMRINHTPVYGSGFFGFRVVVVVGSAPGR